MLRGVGGGWQFHSSFFMGGLAESVTVNKAAVETG